MHNNTSTTWTPCSDVQEITTKLQKRNVERKKPDSKPTPPAPANSVLGVRRGFPLGWTERVTQEASFPTAGGSHTVFAPWRVQRPTSVVHISENEAGDTQQPVTQHFRDPEKEH